MLPNDYDLKSSEIQQIAGEDAVVGFFTALGYQTDHRIKQTSEAMGFPEPLAREVTLIERIADHEQGAFQVYLVEMKRVTVALTQMLVRVFKNRAGLFLLVLTTTDYKQLDFVLLDPLPPEPGKPARGLEGSQITLHPRILSVERRNPQPVDLRVLRRFSFTEKDVDYQLEKLRSAYGIADWSEPLFNNRALFSDYYLNERLPNCDQWKEDYKPSYRALCNILLSVRERFSGKPEEILRTELLEPALKALGWDILPGKGSREDTSKPDYHLQTSDGKSIPCLAYAWDRALDGPDEQRDADTPRENPAQTVVSILETLNAETTGWALMTNGKTWRLYCARAHSRATNYYEIDLEEMLASPDLADAFRYFWLLFRSQSFSDQPSFVDTLLSESESYAKGLGDRLKDRVFEHVFPHFAEGFIEQWGKPALTLTEDELTETYHATLTFLYRLLFLLYAEARDLLPVRETRDYYEKSLKKMKDEIAEKAGKIDDEAPDRLNKSYSATSTDLYDRLNALFQVIDKGDAGLNMPMYNGGLFITFDAIPPVADETEAEEVAAGRFLSAHKIPDRFLALGLDLLARDIDEKKFELSMIDYKSLGVRQLGSIYEGLLEFKLRIAREKMAVVAGKKNEEVVPYAEAVKENRKIKTIRSGADRAERIYRKGDTYLENDKHERKASGSYYTPDYIVKYIVQNTVGPALEAKCEALRPRMREAQKAFHLAVERQKAFQKIGQKGDDPEKTANTFRGLVDDLFDLRVLDPAMGSGHFLVEAVDYLTDRMLAFLNAFPWNPVTATLRQTRQTILEEIQRQNVSVDPARLTDVNLLKRLVLKRCIFGVDLNPMAVELAKVSLWLDCFTLGAPLSFLDHHLKSGNSLIGARVEEVRNEIEMVEKITKRKVAANATEYKKVEFSAMQMHMFGSIWAGAMLATDMMIKVGMLSDVTSGQVRESREAFLQANDSLAPFKRILDVYTSRWFGNEYTKSSQPTLQFLQDETNIPWLKDPQKNRTVLKINSAKVVDLTVKAAREKRFFHWELEFPEVFFGPSKGSAQQIVMKENPGFDAVLGNPPYVSFGLRDVSTIIASEKNYYEENFTKSAEYKISTYALFIECGIRLISSKGYHGFVVPDSFLLGRYFSRIRAHILNQCNLNSLFLIRHGVWESGDVGSTIIYALGRLSNNKNDVVCGIFETLEDFENNVGIKGATPIEFFKNAHLQRFRLISDQSIRHLVIRIEDSREGLGILVEFYSGLIGKHGQESIQTTDPSDGKKFGKLINSSSSLSRYYVEWDGAYCPLAAKLYKSGYSPEKYQHPKIFLNQTGDHLKAVYDSEGYFCLNNMHIGSTINKEYSLLYSTCILNSKLMDFYYKAISLEEGRANAQTDIDVISLLPIRRIAFSTSNTHRESLVGEAKDFINLKNLLTLQKFVDARLTATPEEADVIHDLLAFLAQRMIDLNKQKHAEMKRFIGWLEGVLKVSVDDISGKSKIRNYLGDYQKNEPELSCPELEDILYKNRGKLGVSLSDTRLLAKLRGEFEKSLEVLRPIKSQLAWTDNLIDQIVYKLYGLTEEEIRIVEGNHQ